jgi:hypothetical protein
MRSLRLWILIVLLLAVSGVWHHVHRTQLRIEAEAQGEPYSLIEEGLYQGRLVQEPPPGTAAVLNLCETKDPYTCETHRWVPIPDAAPAPSLEWLREMVNFVDEQRRTGKTVYVHCAAGVSRSGMVVVAYEMQKHGWTRDEALAFVGERRPCTNPNPAFRELLLEWEAEVKRKSR